MTEKFASIKRMKDLMKEHGLKSVFLENILYTTWPDDDRPYSIREVCFDEKGNKISIWQRWDKTLTGHYIEDFEDGKVLMIEKELQNTVSHLKKFTVKMTANIDVLATSLENAQKTVQYRSADDIKEGAYRFSVTDDNKEK